MDRLPSSIAEALEALRAGAGIHPLGPPPERLTVTAEERGLLDRLTWDAPDIVLSMAGDVADALRQATPAVQPLMAEARDVDVFLVALVDQVVDRELRADDAWGADEPARRRLLDLLARHCVARVRGAITTRLLAAGAHTDPRCTRIGRVRLPRRPRFGYDRGESRRRRPRRP